MDEKLQIERARSGDPDAERWLFDAHVDQVYRLAYRMSGDPVFAQEASQDVFVKAYRSLARFRGDSAFSTWLHTITVSVVIDGMRKKKRLRERETQVEDLAAVSPSQEGSDPGLKVKLARAIDSLSGILKPVFVMHDIEGYKHHEIAQILGVPEGTSRARLSRARQELREALGGMIMEKAT